MRSALLGVCFHGEALRERVLASTELTHTDPKAFWAAFAVSLCARAAPDRFTREVLPEIDEPELRNLLTSAAESVAMGESTMEFARSIGASTGVSGYAYQTVPVAIHAWLSHPLDVEQTARAAIACGGDTDTVAAIACALAGAHGGVPNELAALICDWPVNAHSLGCAAQQVDVALDGTTVRRLAPLWWIPLRLIRNLAFVGMHLPLWLISRATAR